MCFPLVSFKVWTPINNLHLGDKQNVSNTKFTHSQKKPKCDILCSLDQITREHNVYKWTNTSLCVTRHSSEMCRLTMVLSFTNNRQQWSFPNFTGPALTSGWISGDVHSFWRFEDMALQRGDNGQHLELGNENNGLLFINTKHFHKRPNRHIAYNSSF